jgi:hypothetical protein
MITGTCKETRKAENIQNRKTEIITLYNYLYNSVYSILSPKINRKTELDINIEDIKILFFCLFSPENWNKQNCLYDNAWLAFLFFCFVVLRPNDSLCRFS